MAPMATAEVGSSARRLSSLTRSVGAEPLSVGSSPLPRDRVEKPVAVLLSTNRVPREGDEEPDFFSEREREEPANVSEAVPTEKKDGCRGVQGTGKQPEPFVIQGSNENRGYPQAGIPVGIGKI